MTRRTSFADHRDGREGPRPAPAVTGIHAIHPRACYPPACVVVVLGAGIAAFAAVTGSPAAIRLVAAGTAAGVAIAVLSALYGASAATRQVQAQIGAVRSLTVAGQNVLQEQVRALLAGEQPVPRVAAPGRAIGSGPFGQLAHEVEQAQYAAEQAVLRLATQVPAGSADQRVEVLVNLARRMQSLAHREIELLDDLEARVEDPDLLKGLFSVDHLATRMRRQSESLAVLGGAASRRQWTRQVSMHEVLRAAVAEVEQYPRVKVVPPVDGVLAGAAVADVIHLIAELIENATKFSPPRTQALLRAQRVTAGLLIEVEDRGLGMLAADRDKMNRLLADPARVNVGELLRDGRIGLFVVATLARRHGIKVQLQANIFGGIQAVVVIPGALTGGADAAPALARPGPADRAEPEPATAAAAADPVPASGPEFAAAPASWPSLPARKSTPPAGAGDSQAGVTAAAGPAGAAQPPQGNTALHGDRPPLPKRTAQAHLAPELRDPPATRRDEPAAGQLTGLMADFRSGVSRSGEDDPAAGD